MREVVIFGNGKIGKTVIDATCNYCKNYKIVAILDNGCNDFSYKGIEIYKPREIINLRYDEIWVCTVHYLEIIRQLKEDYKIDTSLVKVMLEAEMVFDERIRGRYADYLLENCECEDSELRQVLDFVKKHNARMFCYSFYDKYMSQNTKVHFDSEMGMYYAYFGNDKMYLAKKYDNEYKARNYFNRVILEQDDESPHRYENKLFEIRQGEVVVDVGAAEGIFALQHIHTAKYIYLLEADEEWIDALNATFLPYKDKVSIIKRFVSNKDENMFVTLDTLFGDKRVDAIKMDIEGEECKALVGAKRLLEKNENLKLAICTYHHREDFEVIKDYLLKLGYQVDVSKGYLICTGEWELKENKTDFRRAVMFGSN